jgi:hypothetical protein
VALDDHSTEDLDAELVALDDLVIDGDRVANTEVGEILTDSARLQSVNFGQRRGHLRLVSVGGARDYALEPRRVKRSGAFRREIYQGNASAGSFLPAFCRFALRLTRRN